MCVCGLPAMPTPVKESIIDQVSLLFPGAGRIVLCTLNTGEGPLEMMGDWSQVPEFLDPFFVPFPFCLSLTLGKARRAQAVSWCHYVQMPGSLVKFALAFGLPFSSGIDPQKMGCDVLCSGDSLVHVPHDCPTPFLQQSRSWSDYVSKDW